MSTVVRAVSKVARATPRREGPAEVYRALPGPEFGFIDPFLAIGEFRMTTTSQGFGFHHHNGVEFVTYQLDGVLQHGDPSGTTLQIRGGEAMHLVAGDHMTHSETPLGTAESHGIQLWVDLPGKDKHVPYTYKKADLDSVPVYSDGAADVRVIVSEQGPLTLHVPALYIDVTLPAGAEFSHKVPADWNAFVQILSGAGSAGSNRRAIDAHDLALFGTGDQVVVNAESDMHFLLLAGQPNDEGGRGMFG